MYEAASASAGSSVRAHENVERWGEMVGLREITVLVVGCAVMLSPASAMGAQQRAQVGATTFELTYPRDIFDSREDPPRITVRPTLSPSLERIDPAAAVDRYCSPDRCYAGIAPYNRRAIFAEDANQDGAPEVAVTLASPGAHCCSYLAGWWIDPNANGPGQPGWKAATVFSGSTPVTSARVPGQLQFVVGDSRFEYAFTYYAASWRPDHQVRLVVDSNGSAGRWEDVTPAPFIRRQIRRVNRVIRRSTTPDGHEGTLPAKAALQLMLHDVRGARATIRRYGAEFGVRRGRQLERRLQAWGYWPRHHLEAR